MDYIKTIDTALMYIKTVVSAAIVFISSAELQCKANNKYILWHPTWEHGPSRHAYQSDIICFKCQHEEKKHEEAKVIGVYSPHDSVSVF